MNKTFLYDIPVYRLSYSKYYADMNDYIEHNLHSGLPDEAELIRDFYNRHPNQKSIYKSHLIKRFGGMWEFNEVIGHIKVHLLGTQIRGEYFGVDAKIIRKTRNKQFSYLTHKLAPEICIPFEASSETIYALILKYLERCQNELKGRHLDYSSLTTLGPYIDWRALLNAHNRNQSPDNIHNDHHHQF